VQDNHTEELRDQIINFCNIQLQVLKNKEESLRKDILDCKIQKEFLTQILSNVYNLTSKVYKKPMDTK